MNEPHDLTVATVGIAFRVNYELSLTLTMAVGTNCSSGRDRNQSYCPQQFPAVARLDIF